MYVALVQVVCRWARLVGEMVRVGAKYLILGRFSTSTFLLLPTFLLSSTYPLNLSLYRLSLTLPDYKTKYLILHNLRFLPYIQDIEVCICLFLHVKYLLHNLSYCYSSIIRIFTTPLNFFVALYFIYGILVKREASDTTKLAT